MRVHADSQSVQCNAVAAGQIAIQLADIHLLTNVVALDVFSGVCLFVCLCVCVFVSEHDNFRTSKRRIVKVRG